MSSTEKSAANKRIAKKKTANRNIRSIFDNNYLFYKNIEWLLV